MVSIARVRPEDRDDWLALWAGYLAFYESEVDAATTEATFAQLSAEESGDGAARMRGAIARDDAGRAIGIVHWLTHLATWTRSDYCYLEDLFVTPEARGTGAGHALIEHVRDWAIEHGSMKVYWLTAETNAVARALYDRVATRTGFIHYEIPLEPRTS